MTKRDLTLCVLLGASWTLFFLTAYCAGGPNLYNIALFGVSGALLSFGGVIGESFVRSIPIFRKINGWKLSLSLRSQPSLGSFRRELSCLEGQVASEKPNQAQVPTPQAARASSSR
jgi:hypothetical protein